MKKIISSFIILSLIINFNVSCLVAMSPQQQALYQAAIVELDTCSALTLLQKNNINLNEPIEVDGKKTTFLHELFKVAIDFYNFKLSDGQKSQSDNNPSFFTPLIDYSSGLYQQQSYDDYKNDILFDSIYSIHQLFRLFLGFGANVDLRDYSGISVRELIDIAQIRQEDKLLADLIIGCPSIEDPNYKNYKDRSKNYIVSEIKCKKLSLTLLLSILLLFSTLLFFT